MSKSILISHGYHLDGSGSCIYVRNVAEAFLKQGVNVYLVCQEPNIEAYDSVSEAYELDEKGKLGKLFSRECKTDGKLTYIRPFLRNGLLPVFVGGKFPGFDNVKAFGELSDDELQSYIDTQLQSILAVASYFEVITIFANHIVMMPYIAFLAKRENSKLRYHLIPHGSEIEYLIKSEKRYFDLAVHALEGASSIISGSQEMINRLNDLFPNSKEYSKKYELIPIGVDVEQFAAPLKLSVSERVSEMIRAVETQVSSDKDQVNKIEHGFLEGIRSIDFERDQVLINFGKVIPGKGVQDLLVLVPELLKSLPRLRVVVAGNGPYIEFFRKMLSFLQAGDSRSFFEIIDQDEKDHGEEFHDPYRFVRGFFDVRDREQYFKDASSFEWKHRVVFSGYLKHTGLRYLLCLSHVAVFPSIVKEAYPLALMEAMATGVYPLASDIGGLHDGIHQLDDLYSEDILSEMKIPMGEKKRLIDLSSGIVSAFGRLKPREETVSYIEANYSWDKTCDRLAKVFF